MTDEKKYIMLSKDKLYLALKNIRELRDRIPDDNEKNINIRKKLSQMRYLIENILKYEEVDFLIERYKNLFNYFELEEEKEND